MNDVVSPGSSPEEMSDQFVNWSALTPEDHINRQYHDDRTIENGGLSQGEVDEINEKAEMKAALDFIRTDYAKVEAERDDLRQENQRLHDRIAELEDEDGSKEDMLAGEMHTSMLAEIQTLDLERQLALAQARIKILEQSHGFVAKERDEAQRRADTDPVTGLRSKSNYLAVKEQEKIPDKPFEVVCIDINQFKAVNDAIGHEAADTVLASLGNIIQTTIIEHNPPLEENGFRGTAFNVGGDEYILWLDKAKSREMMEIIKQRFASYVRETFNGSGQSLEKIFKQKGNFETGLAVGFGATWSDADADSAKDKDRFYQETGQDRRK